MPNSTCPICKLPKAGSETGSLTQWISVCSCEVVVENDESENAISICRKCNKRVRDGRIGSFTQFIFRSDTCSCKAPVLVKNLLEQQLELENRSNEQPSNLLGESADLEEETGLDVDNQSFPLDRYTPLVLIGSGSGGSVYLARDRLLNKKVAVKTLHVLDQKLVISFQEEARVISNLKHEGITQLLDFGLVSHSTPYMVLEYIPGISLREIIDRDGYLEWTECINLFKQVCDALSYAHKQGIYHRDIKPDNILVVKNSESDLCTRLIDFGIAKLITDSKEKDGPTLAGTPLYMSPDQGKGHEYDIRSEIYSIGCVLFESLSGKPPFIGDSALETLSLHANSQLPRMVDVFNSINKKTSTTEFKCPESLELLVAKCLEKNPDDRFQSINDLMNVLESIEQQYQADTNVYALPQKHESHKKVKLTVAFACLIILVSGLLVAQFFKSNEEIETEKNPSEQKIKPEINLNIHPIDPNLFFEKYKSDARTVKLKGMLQDKDFQKLTRFTKATEIDLSDNWITTKTTGLIKSPYIQTLSLTRSNVESLQFISKMKSLRTLRLQSTLISNKDIEQLASLPNLVNLNLRDTEIDDRAVPFILNIKSLQELTVTGSLISKKSTKELRRKMPACSVNSKPALVPKMDTHELTFLLKNKKYSLLEKLYLEAIARVEAAQGKESTILSYFFGQLGKVQLLSGHHKKAHDSLDRAIFISEKNQEQYWIVDALHYKLQLDGNPADKVKLRDKLIGYVKATDGATPKLISIYYDQANDYKSLKDQALKVQFIRKIISLGNTLTSEDIKLSTKHKAYLARAYYKLARISESNANYKSAEIHMQNSIVVWEKINKIPYRSYVIERAKAYRRMATYCARNNDYISASKYQKKYLLFAKKYKLKIKNFESETKKLQQFIKSSRRDKRKF